MPAAERRDKIAKQMSIQKALKTELKQTETLQCEIRKLKVVVKHQTARLQQRIENLQQENQELLEEADILNDRHQSHTEELRYMQNEFLCIKGHLEKLRGDMESLDRALQTSIAQGKRAPRQNEQLETSIFKLKERQEFTCVLMDNTISSIDEIINEYVPEKIEYKGVEDHKTIEQIEKEEKEARMVEQKEVKVKRDASKTGGVIAAGDDDADDTVSLSIETPQQKEAEMNRRAKDLFRLHQSMFKEYVEKKKEENPPRRFKDFFEDYREKVLGEEAIRQERRRRKRDSQIEMLEKVRRKQSDLFKQVSVMLNNENMSDFFTIEEGIDEASNDTNSVDMEQKPATIKPVSDAISVSSAMTDSTAADEKLISLSGGNLNDVFKQYKQAKASL